MPYNPAAIREVSHRYRVPLPIQLPWRFFVTGAYLGPARDNASFLHDATEDYRGKPVTKLTRARWRRVVARNALLTAPAVLALAAFWLGWIPLLAYAVGVALFGGWRGLGAARGVLFRRRLNREWTYPAGQLAARILAIRYNKRWARETVDVPRGWGSGDAAGPAERQAVRLALPAGVPLPKGTKDALTSQVGARLGIVNPQAEWSEAGNRVWVTLRATPVPPAEVTWESIQTAIAEAGEEAIVLGRGPGGRLATISLAEDAPHMSMSGASGTGKSVLARVAMVQRIERYGDGVLIMDPKKFSHWRWAGDGKVDRRRVRYAWRTEDLHQAWLDVATEMARRIEMDEGELATQRRVFVLVEEINVQTKRLARHWRAERKRLIVEAKLALADDPGADVDLGDLDPPLQSPAIVAMQELVGMGRELKLHAVVAAQRLSASVFGGNGGDIRESFQGGRLIAKWDRKLWKMLVDTIAYVACPTGPRGIWGLAKGEDFMIFRVPFLDEAMANRILANSAVPVAGPVLGQQDGLATVDGQSRPALANPVTLAKAAGQLPGLTLDSLRAAGQRDATFPEPLAKPNGQPYGQTEARLYDMSALVHWAANR